MRTRLGRRSAPDAVYWPAFVDVLTAVVVVLLLANRMSGPDHELGRLRSENRALKDELEKKSNWVPPRPAKTLREYITKRIAKRLKQEPEPALLEAIAPASVEATGSILQSVLLPAGAFDSRSSVPSQPSEKIKADIQRVFAALFDRGLLQDWAAKCNLALVAVKIHETGSVGEESQYLSGYSDILVHYLQAEAENLGIQGRVAGSTADYSPRRGSGRGSLNLHLYFDLTKAGRDEAEQDFNADPPREP